MPYLRNIMQMWQFTAVLAPMLVILAFLAAGVFLAVRNTGTVQVNHYRVPMGKEFKGKPLVLVHMTDLHLSPWILPSHLKRTVDRINLLDADYVAITGDFVSHYREYAAGCGRALKELKPGKAVVGVLGNHDYWVDSAYIAGILKDAGVHILKNRAFPDNLSDESVAFAGVDDPYTGKSLTGEALTSVPPGMPKILLSHSPDVFHEAEEEGADLVLAGHTHGGQICLPFFGAIYVPSRYGTRYASGWFFRGKTRMYVNRGMGEVFPPIRLFCPREVAVFHLQEGEGNPRLIKRDSFII